MGQGKSSEGKRGGRGRPVSPAEWGLVDRVVARCAFPVVTTVATFGGYALMGEGVDPALALTPVLVVALATIGVLERLFPHQRSWLSSHGDVGVDVGWVVTNGAVSRFGEPLVLGFVVWIASFVSEDLGAGYWPAAWPMLGQFFLALLLVEFVEYWAHRAMHEIDWMWRFHAVHHSAPRLYFLNSARFHPIDAFVVGTCKLIPVAILGASAEVMALVTLFSGIHGAFQHSNLKLQCGPLNWVFSMAELHRWHHSRITAESNHNYGGNLIVWDIVFGTRWLPEGRQPPEEIGMESLPGFPQGFFRQVASPFAWQAVVEDSAPREGERAN